MHRISKEDRLEPQRRNKDFVNANCTFFRKFNYLPSFDRDFNSLSFPVCLKSFLPKINEKMVENIKAVGQGGEAIFLLNFSYIVYSIALYFMPIDVKFKSTSIDI